MRILILAQLFQPEPAFKGLPFAKALVRLGHEVEVITCFPHYPGGKVYEGYKITASSEEVLDGIPIHRTAVFPSHDKSGLKRMLTYASFMLSAWAFGPGMVKQKPDVIYVYNLVTLMPVYKRLRKRFGCPVVVDVQDLWPESVANSGMMQKPAILNVLTRWSRDAYQAADKLTCLSPGFKENLVARGIPDSNVEVIYNWGPEDVSPMPKDDSVAKELGIDLIKFNLMFAGTMGVAQNLDPVLDAAKICAAANTNIHFLFLGGGVDEERLKERVATEAINNVIFLPRQPMSEMGKVLACADSLLVHLKDDPLFRITIPSKTQAYLATGIPILMAMRGDAADLVEKSGGGILAEPGDAESIASAAIDLSDKSEAELKEIGGRGRKFYEEELSMPVGVRKFVAVFESLVSSGKS